MKTIGSPGAIQSQVDETSPRAVIHLDLDGGKQIYRVHGWRWRGEDDPLFATGMRRALDFFERAGVKATLFVIAEDLGDARKRELLQEAIRRGHEIASHSLTHRKLTALTSGEKRREIFESRERLASELGVEVRGFRAPGFALDRESLELIDEAGYAYDSSLFPGGGFARGIEVDRLNEWPHSPLADRRLVELPLPAYDPLPFPFHPCYSLMLGSWYFRLGLWRFQRAGAPLVLLFHLADFADRLPDDYMPNMMARLYLLTHLSVETRLRRCAWMLSLTQRKYQLVTTADLLDQISESARTPFASRPDKIADKIIDESCHSKSQERRVAS